MGGLKGAEDLPKVKTMDSIAVETVEMQIRGMEVETADTRLGFGLVTRW